jgi:hypothetical protein
MFGLMAILVRSLNWLPARPNNNGTTAYVESSQLPERIKLRFRATLSMRSTARNSRLRQPRFSGSTQRRRLREPSNSR